MTKNDYLKKIENLSKDEQIKTLQEYLVQHKNNNDSNAAEIVCELLANEYEQFGSQIELIDIYLTNKKYKDVIAYAKSFFEKNPDTIKFLDEVLYSMGKAYEELQDWDNAMRSYIKICDNIENKANAFANGVIADSEKRNLVICLNRVGKIWYNLKQYDNAFTFFDKSWDITPTIFCAYHIGLLKYNGLGTEKDVQVAEKLLLQIYNSDTDITNTEKGIACYTLGVLYAKEKGYINITKSKEYFNKAKALGYSITDDEIQQITNNIATTTTEEKKSGGCYVATCVYGSYDCPQVWTLRRFRDDILSSHLFGRIFIKTYYAVSPTTVKLFGKYKWFHKIFKKPLDLFVAKLNNNGVKNTKYNDK